MSLKRTNRPDKLKTALSGIFKVLMLTLVFAGLTVSCTTLGQRPHFINSGPDRSIPWGISIEDAKAEIGAPLGASSIYPFMICYDYRYIRNLNGVVEVDALVESVEYLFNDAGELYGYSMKTRNVIDENGIYAAEVTDRANDLAERYTKRFGPPDSLNSSEDEGDSLLSYFSDGAQDMEYFIMVWENVPFGSAGEETRVEIQYVSIISTTGSAQTLTSIEEKYTCLGRMPESISAFQYIAREDYDGFGAAEPEDLNGEIPVVLFWRNAGKAYRTRFSSITPLGLAVRLPELSRRADFVEQLLFRGADPNAELTARSSSGENSWTTSCLAVAVAEKRSVDVIRLLLEAGADPDAPSPLHKDGMTPRELAEFLKDPETIALFSEY